MSPPDHRWTLAVVFMATINTVLYSYNENYHASLWSFMFSVASIFVARYQDLTHKCLTTARESVEGWQASVAITKQALDLKDKP